MELLHLTYFKHVAENLSYTLAAQELYVSQPALSMTIKKLEKELNTKLFVKNGRNISLTKNGHVLYQSVNKIFDELQRVERIISANEDVKQKTVHFASSHSRLMPSTTLNQYIESNPDNKFNLEITTNKTIMSKLISHSITFALNSIKLSHPLIHSEKIINEDIVLTYPKEFDNNLNTDILYDPLIFKSFLFSAHNQEYNKMIKDFLDYKNIKIHNANYVDDYFVFSLLKNRSYFSYIPASICKELNLPYIKHPSFIISSAIYLSTLKSVELNQADLNMYRYIKEELLKYQSSFIIEK
ncbi:LysR family HTH-type transcriptional regulator [Staphylococcus petrasii]|uniref:LysR family HTH-type transcriptional regulator n=1 Tax=Staphylococcus petrasii TaxID=1276936 RepID=A0A380FUW7_9STAP|nr:LysR family transcriptional regulator [Staphylococcus petrasii]PNZ30542.1 transcriptional regulator [Staphylococcus petrasii]TGE12187.1 LysR family transcriptional regulator [Staphylococcus petrasii]TGE17087.1 LysR family transcriptional regulator [Staphylococcus petrasii]SUM42669.1 LysR family HTH-type transcriptional regulator [Staphylococcus petrasii]